MPGTPARGTRGQGSVSQPFYPFSFDRGFRHNGASRATTDCVSAPFNTAANLQAMPSDSHMIRCLPLFSMLTAEQVEHVAEAAIKRTFKRGHRMVEQGEKFETLFIILSGKARVVSEDFKGREVIICTLQPGEHFGEMSLIDGATHSATVVVESECDCLLLRKYDLDRLLDVSPGLVRAVTKGLAQRLRSANRKIESLALMDVYGRVAQILLELAQRDLDGQLVIQEKITRTDIAKMIGCSREQATRAIGYFEKREYIKTREDGSVVIFERLHSLI